jgi:MoaA/NifB/PqqE/SkfB family radical SAM enzyme
VISAIKESRHGIPFGVHTSGIMNNKEIATNLKENVGISSVQVTLGSGDPQSYSQVVRKRKDLNSNASFGQVCSFIAQCAESGFPVTAAVAGGKHKASGNELAKALGAVDVEVYDSIQ